MLNKNFGNKHLSIYSRILNYIYLIFLLDYFMQIHYNMPPSVLYTIFFNYFPGKVQDRYRYIINI